MEQGRHHILLGCLRVIGLAAGVMFSGAAFCDPTVHFAGFAYTGAYQDISKSFPLTHDVDAITASGVSVLDQELRKRVQASKFDGFTLDFQGLGDVRTGDSLAVAFGLNRESISVEQLVGVYKVLATIDAQVLVFDMQSSQVIASYPFGVVYIDTTSTVPDEAYERGLVRQLYLGSLPVNIFDEFVTALSKVTIKPHYGHTLQVTDVTVDDAAKAFLPDPVRADLPALQGLLATEFSEYLSKSDGVPVLPYMKDHAIGNKIAARFANGNVYDLKVPEPDYAVSIELLKFKKVKFDETDAGASWIYGAFIQLKTVEPLSNHVYMDATIKQGETKVVPASQTLIDDWAAYQVTLQALMKGLSETLASPDSSWVHSHIASPDGYTQLQEFKKVVESCK